MKEIKAFPFKMEEIDGEGNFKGYASVFGNVDLGGEVVDRGAFKKTLRESGGKVPILDHHDPARQIGWNLEAREDERGLFVRGQLNLKVQDAVEKYALMKQANEIGGRTGLSIGFRTIRDMPDKKDPEIRRLKEVQLFEYSIVTFPMNTDANVTTVKARQELLQQFLRTEIGLDEAKVREALYHLQSLFEDEPAPSHSALLRADYLEFLEHSLKQLLETIRS